MTDQEQDQTKLVIRIAAVVAILALLPAIFGSRLPYSYFMNLRWVVLIASAVCGVLLRGNAGVLALCVALGLLFNPFSPFHATRDLWRVLDAAAAAGFCWILFGSVKKKA